LYVNAIDPVCMYCIGENDLTKS